MLTDSFELGGGLKHISQIAGRMPDFEFIILAKRGTSTNKFADLQNVQLVDKGYSLAKIRKYKPELIHVHHLKPLLAILKYPFSQPSVPLLATLHGLHIHKFEFKKTIGSRIQLGLRFRLEKYLFQKTDVLIAVSKEDREFVRNTYSIDNCLFIPNGVDFSGLGTQDKTSGSDLKKELNLPENSFLCLTPARFDFQKGHDILMQAIAILKTKQLPHHPKFLLAGEGDTFDSIRHEAERLSISEDVLFLRKRNDVCHLMKACDLLILPSRWEGLPIALIEAGGCKIPVVASDTYGNREIIDHLSTGLLFRNESPESLANILTEVLENRFDTDRISTNLYQKVTTQYSLEQMVEKLRQVYLNSVKSNGNL